MKINRKTAWINVNAECNLKCRWCYNMSNVNPEMQLSVFSNLLKQLSLIGTKYIVLIGGEPTICDNYFQFISILRYYKFEFKLITNGIMFSDFSFLNQSIEFGLQNISFSLKGYNIESFYHTTNSNKYELYSKGIHAINKSCINASFIFTFGENELKNLIVDKLAAFLEEHKIHNLIIEDTHPYFFHGKIIKQNFKSNKLSETYDLLTRRKIDVIMKLNKPLCHYNEKFVELLIKEKKLISKCTVRNGGGIYFDVNGNLILCNALYDVKLCRYQEDNNLEAILNYLDNNNFSNRISKCMPMCKECRFYLYCGGSCILNWLE